MGQFIYGGNQSCLPLYSCALAFIPRVKLDTEGYCCGFSALEDEATNKTVQKNKAVFPLESRSTAVNLTPC